MLPGTHASEFVGLIGLAIAIVLLGGASLVLCLAFRPNPRVSRASRLIALLNSIASIAMGIALALLAVALTSGGSLAHALILPALLLISAVLLLSVVVLGRLLLYTYLRR